MTRSSVAGLVRIPFSAREAEATETLASRATVVIVGTSVSAGVDDWLLQDPPVLAFLKRFTENVYSTATMS